MAKLRNDVLKVDLDACHEVDLIVDVENTINALMLIKDISRADLARRMGVSKVRVHHILKSNKNITLRTLSQVFTALEEKIEIRSPSLDRINQQKQRASREKCLIAGFESKSLLAADFVNKVPMSEEEAKSAFCVSFNKVAKRQVGDAEKFEASL